MSLSKRKKREIRAKKKQGIDMAQRVLDSLNNKLNAGENLNTKELDSMKWAIKYIDDTEHEVKEKIEEALPEGELKRFVDNHIRLQNKMIEFTGNRRYKLTKEEYHRILDEMDYYVCDVCGFAHNKGRKCAIEEYMQFKEKNIDKEIDNSENGEPSE